VKNGSLAIRADVPGLEPKDFELSVFGNVLTMKGERKQQQEVKKDEYIRRETSYGSFERRLTCLREPTPNRSRPALRMVSST
jgi:HSP20 family protein